MDEECPKKKNADDDSSDVVFGAMRDLQQVTNEWVEMATVAADLNRPRKPVHGPAA